VAAPVLRLIRFPLHIAANCAGLACRLIPRERRFDVAKVAAAALTPFLRLPGTFRFRRARNMETPREVALQMVLRTLDRVGTAYDPIVRVHGAEPFAIAREAGRGLLMIGPHAALSKLVVRYLCDQEYSPIIVVADSMRFGGMRRPPRQIVISPNFLVRVRTELRAGSIVGAMADHDRHNSRRTFEVQTPAGPVLLSDGLLRIAQKSGSAILFIASALSDDGVVHIYLEPPSPSSKSIEEIANDFAAFVHSHVERVQRAIQNEVASTDHCSLPNTLA
jgi:lauroyl/myristoyl acyltransferase